MIPPACILTDIEGTTTAIAFVKETLFPFAEAELDAFLDAHEHDPAVAAILAEVRAIAPRAGPAFGAAPVDGRGRQGHAAQDPCRG